MLSAVGAAALEKLITQALKMDPERATVVRQLNGKVVAIELRGTGLKFYLQFDGDSVHVLTAYDAPANATIAGTPLSLLRLGLHGHERDSLFSGDVEISGDMDIGKNVRALVDGLDIDWEEQLSRIVGDVLAHQIGNAARGLKTWAQQSADTLRDDASEYLREESHLLVQRDEVDAFLASVDRLRNDVERLDLRYQRLLSRRRSESR